MDRRAKQRKRRKLINQAAFKKFERRVNTSDLEKFIRMRRAMRAK